MYPIFAVDKTIKRHLVCCWAQGKFPHNLRDAVIKTVHKKMVKCLIDIVTWESTYSPSLAKYSPGSISIGSYKPSQKKASPRASVTSESTVAQRDHPPSTAGEEPRAKNGRHATIVDLRKAFDSVSRIELWLMLRRLDCPSNFLQMVIQAARVPARSDQTQW